MGGYNSSRWHGYSKKITVNQCSQINIGHIAKALLVRRFNAGEAVYYNDQGAVKYSDFMLNRVRKAAGVEPTRTPAGQGIRLTRTACNYGDYRYWLLCPDCSGRCAKLYRVGGVWACRKCHDLTYRSAQEARHYSGWIGELDKRLSCIVRAELVLKKTEKCRGSSKRFWRLARRYEQIMAGLTL